MGGRPARAGNARRTGAYGNEIEIEFYDHAPSLSKSRYTCSTV
jgi:hypothetical protein